MFGSLREKFLTLPDYVQVWPGHGAGSSCGKALGAVPTSTVGYERLFSWWGRLVEDDDERGFVESLLADQPDAPVYFGRMKRQNKNGPALLGEREPLVEYEAGTLKEGLERGRSHLYRYAGSRGLRKRRGFRLYKRRGFRLYKRPGGQQLRQLGFVGHRSRAG